MSEPLSLGRYRTRLGRWTGLRRKLEKAAPGPVACCYEAGRCGYALQRQLERGRVQCQVIAPALVPRKPGERIKTDRRDARKLVELHRAGLLAEVRPPTPAEGGVRDLCRARDDARADRQRCRHRLGKLLLRRGLHYPGRAWTQAHRRWVNGLTWPHPADRVVLDDYLLAIDHLEARLMELEGARQKSEGRRAHCWGRWPGRMSRPSRSSAPQRHWDARSTPTNAP